MSSLNQFHLNLLSLSIFLFFIYSSESATTNETDRLSLLQFKDQITQDPHNVLSSWNDSLHFCQWPGITCSTHQRVTVLNLTDHNLVGRMSPHIANLSFLTAIDLQNNGFQGPIPQEIGRLSRLRSLMLTTNSFEGPVPTNLSSGITAIRLNENKLTGEIPIELSYLSSLSVLFLGVNNLTGTIPPWFGNFSSLTRLSVGRNNLHGDIPNDLGRLRSLEFLVIAENNLSGVIPPSLYNITSMYFFAGATNQLRGQLPLDIGITLPNLRNLYLGGNFLTGPIPISLSNASGLAELDLAYNNFRGSVPINFGVFQGLVWLNLGGNQFADDLSFVTSLTNCTNLELLHAGENRFTGVLPNSIANLSTRLTMLLLESNRLHGNIPTGIENLSNLSRLIMSDNSFTGTLPMGIGNLYKLEDMELSRNRFSGQIPSSIGNLTRLSVLLLPGNDLTGSIPSSLGNCRQLQELDLSSNILSGTIPREVVRLSSLSNYLNLSRNSFTSLPSEVGELVNLGGLDLSKNRLIGEIPNTLGNCRQLEYLYMDDNFFQGTIPPSLSNLRALQVLNLSRNNLSGQIPLYLETFQFLQYLNLSFNDLHGEVPRERVFKNISRISVLGNGKLCGGIIELRLPTCPDQASRKQKRSVIVRVIVPVASAILFLALLSCFLATLYWRRKSRRKPVFVPSWGDHRLNVSYAELLKATDGFSLANLIGSGNYGSVYKGILDDNDRIIAVKVLDLQQRGASQSFLAECEALRNTRHRNLVKILTSCSSIDFKGNDFKALVFEYMSNGSLEDWLHPSEDGCLTLIQRLNMMIDVASALDYLHNRCQRPIVHRDLKPSNVLLDDEMNAHVGDFGLAKLLLEAPNNPQESQSNWRSIKGSIGYIAPEYGMGASASTHGDVYSYGILLLEIFTGKRPTDDMFKDDLSLHIFAEMALPDRVLEIVDPRLFAKEDGDGAAKCLAAVIRIGVLCSKESPRERLEMDDVVVEMTAIRDMWGTRSHKNEAGLTLT